jgi:hypothetical protein
MMKEKEKLKDKYRDHAFIGYAADKPGTWRE